MSGKNNKVAIKAATIKVQPKNNTVKMAGGGSGNQTRPSKPAPVGQALPVVHGREVAGPNPYWHQSERDQKHSMGGRGNSGLSAVSQDYALAVANPKEAPLVGIPTDWPLTESFKFRAFAKGSVTIGTQKVGFIQVAPKRFLSNDVTAYYFSTSLFALTTTPVTYVEAGVAIGYSNSPYLTAQYGATGTGLQGRAVGCMVRVWYTGTELNISGEAYAVRQPDNETMNGGYSVAGINAFPGSLRTPINSRREPIEVYYLPTKAAEVEYSVPSAADPTCMSIMLTGVAGEQFAYEIYGIFEAIGTGVPSTTRTAGDPNGLTAIIESAEAANSTYVGSAVSLGKSIISNASSALQYMSEATGVSVKDIVRGTAKYLTTNGMQAIRAYRSSGGRLAITPMERLLALGHKVSVDSGPAFSIALEELEKQAKAGDVTLLCREPYVFTRKGDRTKYALFPIPVAPPPFWKSNFVQTALQSHKPHLMLPGYLPPQVGECVQRAGMMNAFVIDA